MILRNIFVATALSAASLLPTAPATAQTGIQAGAVVKDPQGGEVGTITAVEGDQVTLRTDRHQARIPASAFTVQDGAVVINATRDALNGQIDQMLAQAQQAIAVGAVVHDREGAVIGPIESADAEKVVVRFGDQPIELPRTHVGNGANGLVIGATVAELRAQLAAAPAATAN